jgi:hypothetical protein
MLRLKTWLCPWSGELVGGLERTRSFACRQVAHELSQANTWGILNTSFLFILNNGSIAMHFHLRNACSWGIIGVL